VDRVLEARALSEPGLLQGGGEPLGAGSVSGRAAERAQHGALVGDQQQRRAGAEPNAQLLKTGLQAGQRAETAA
jgi:hypothetical protein